MKRILAFILMGMAAISLGACENAQDAASEEAAAEAAEEPAGGEEEPEEAAEESAEVVEDDSKDAADTTESGTVDISSFRPGQALTGSDREILTANKGTLLSRTLAESEFHQIINTFMSSPYVTDTAYKLAGDGLVWNGGSRWDCSAAVLYLINYYLLPYDEAYQPAEEADPLFAVSQAMSWGDPVYTYENVDRINENDPGDLQYGDLLFYGTADESDFKISHVAVYLGQYYLDSGDTGYYQLENDREAHENTKEGRDDGVKISPFRAGDGLVHVARIM